MQRHTTILLLLLAGLALGLLVGFACQSSGGGGSDDDGSDDDADDDADDDTTPTDDDVDDDTTPSDDDVDDDTGPDDDVNNGFDDSSLTFTMPYSLGPNTQYTFVFEVFNANMPDPEGKRGIWIREVIVNLPPNYVLAAEANQPAAPSCLHTGDGYCDHWEVNFDDGANQITWQNFGSSPGHYGDIRDQDVQTFAFLAITDDIPTNAFPWRLDGDSGDFVEGMASIGGTDDDTYVDDDTISDDDTTLSCQDAIAYFYEVCGFSMGYYSEDQVKAWCNSPSPPDWFGEAVQCIVDYYGNCDAIAECYNNIPGLAL